MIASSVQPISKVQRQERFWRDVCKEMGPRNYNSRLGSWTGNNHYDKRLDVEHETPRTPKELAEIRARLRKAKIESSWASITKA